MFAIHDLRVSGAGGALILDGVSLALDKGEIVCLTGTSGSGKTTLIKAVLGMDGASLTVLGGDIRIDGESVLGFSPKARRALCGRVFGFIPQNPMTAFFRQTKIGAQMAETFELRFQMKRRQARELAEETLARVNLKDVRRVLEAYPSQLSGGMLQRVTMAILLGTKPAYVLADEPTSALDRDNRDLLLHLLADYREAGILFVSHDAEAIKALCKTTFVLQSGRIIEAQSTERLFQNPLKDWTRSFVEAAKHQEEGKSAWKRLR
jgi:ABC-type glutathione transport system ATPase component